MFSIPGEKLPESDRPYHGEVSRHGFVVRRTTDMWDRSSGSVRIAGDFHEQEGGGTLVQITIEMEGLSQVGTIMIYAMAGFFSMIAAVVLIRPSDGPAGFVSLIIPFVVLGVIMLVVNLRFDFAAAPARQFFRDLFDTDSN